jgi:hypothetical protein
MRNFLTIKQLYPTVVRMVDDKAFDVSGNEVSYDKTIVEAYIASHAYKQQRAAEYPSIGDQLDALFHAGVFPEAMAAEIQAIKDKYPKS